MVLAEMLDNLFVIPRMIAVVVWTLHGVVLTIVFMIMNIIEFPAESTPSVLKRAIHGQFSRQSLKYTVSARQIIATTDGASFNSADTILTNDVTT